MIAVYLWGWIVTTALTFWAAVKFGEDRSAPPLKALAVISVIAGAAWPALALGMVQVGSLAAYSKLRH